MQLGTRWDVGAEPPATLPAEFVARIREAEQDADPSWRWTLTWLEGRPVAELPDGTTIR